MSKSEDLMEDLVTVAESIVRAIQQKEPPAVVQVEQPAIEVKPAIEVHPAPAGPAPEVVVNLPEHDREKCAYVVEITERSGQGYIRKMTIKPQKP
jgi:hypothetical protein